jgi:hypothetical protein
MTLPSRDRIELPLLKEILAAGVEIRPRDVYAKLRKYSQSELLRLQMRSKPDRKRLTDTD